ncbi:methyl-accepting chemotaxis protein [Morganella morganii]|uniref:methyl-accepting chemotaxis protein n=1 Tax=Morganella morganii TaxID=582 RepID=UPI0028D4DD8E|nr:methyl-accepting chemotaxis protein [Morganella morganii]WNP30226.1 methyl-accepting chemotaxis protein [Morganella morganii]HDF2329327.1 CZB domain-containing protein [Morganella morganii]
MLNIMKKWIFLQKKQPVVSREEPEVYQAPSEHAKTGNADEQKHYHGEILCRHLLDGIAAIEIIRNSLLDSGTRLAGEQGTLDEIAMHNSETRRYMQELCSVLDDISEHADKGLDYTQKLVSVLGQINQNINNIERLANQTNLLAVNSAIEASHVGSRGAGFSVIAREIKQLSGEIQDEAINITTFTGKIKSHAKAIHTDAEDNQKLVSSIRDIAVQAEERLQDMITSSSRMEAIIRFVAVQQFLNTVKLDHVIWKGDIYRRLLDGNADLSVNDHTQCRLGKWYYADEGQRFIGHDAYRKLERPHRLVHLSGRLALEARAQGSLQDEERHLSAMEDASREVIENIDDLLASISY